DIELVAASSREATILGERIISDNMRGADIKGARAINDISSDMVFSKMERPLNASYGIPEGDTTSLSRASDEEKEQNSGDFPNGSLMTSEKETINGELSYDPQGTNDIRDWYKFNVVDLLEEGGSFEGLRNVSVSLLDITDDLGTYTGLYEYSTDASGNLIDDYADMIYISVLYTDPYGGIIDVGGFETSFDDQDDTDGWIYDGDHPDFPDNWTFRFVTGRNSVGEEDTNGWEDGLSEMGWYYIGISFNFFTAEGAPEREAFTIKYSLEIDTTEKEDTDPASNTLETALSDIPDGEKYIHSAYQPMDWYKLQGSDPQKLWNISVRINRTGGEGFYNDETGMRWDDWLHVFFVWRDPGEDEEWNTEDDTWMYFHHILSLFLSGGAFVSNANQTIGYYYPSTVLSAEHREAYIGLIAEPATFRVEEGQVTDVYYPYWTCWSNYTVDLDIREEDPNNAPQLSDIEVYSDWPDEEAGGHFGSEFTFNVTYTDEDNDPPRFLEMVIDPDTFEQETIDMMEYETDITDLDYTDGKVYSYTATGEEIGDDHSPHALMFNASDMLPAWSIRTMMWTGPIHVDDTLIVWDDEPVALDPLYEGIPEFTEDVEGEFPLNGFEAMFVDPENDFRSFWIWDGEDWTGDLDLDLLLINISVTEFGSFAVVTPKPDQNGQEIVRIQARDLHSSIEYKGPIVVKPVNDLPEITGVKVGTRTYDVTVRNSFSYSLDLSKEGVTAKEDQVTEMCVLAEDKENVPLKFYIGDGGDNWDGVLEIDENTGKVTIIPTNEDVKRERDEIMIEVHDDGGEQDAVEILIKIEAENTPDDPSVQIPVTVRTAWEQGETVEIIASGDDPDPDDTLTYEVSVFDVLGGEIDPLVDQIVFADLVENVDWGFDENTGRFWWDLSDFKIWQISASEISETVQVTLVFRVTDSTGRSVVTEFTLVLSGDGAPIVEVEFNHLIYDEHQMTAVPEGLDVNFWADIMLNEEEIPVTVKWDLGGGEVIEGMNINHTFDSYGTRTVQYWFETDFTTSVKQTISLTLVEPPVIDVDDDDDGGGSSIGLYIAVGASIGIIALIAIVLILIRKKGTKEEEGVHLPEGHSRSLSSGGSRSSLDTGEREHLPSARGADDPVMTTCPNCGSPVKNDWYLCPECKNPLQ
ncbi:MAG: hypothetical protein U9R75_04850, partial [Candidatus Thermoplasmatota archaeon]|nr:hypothetical protein [Candidatus Thermoplasmatota archaeon]